MRLKDHKSVIMPAMIILENITLQRGTKRLLEKTSATIHPGRKIALIGANGAGKSSLFSLLLGELTVEEGTLQIPGQWRMAHMAQEVQTTDRAALDFVIDGDQVLRKLEADIARAETDQANDRLANLHQALDEIDGYTAPLRAEQLLEGLGFSAVERASPVSSFSGGWRIRLNLARALMCPSDFLMLDEPTNHLDMDTTLWLERWLQNYPGTVLLISHDRDFIDNVCEEIFHIEHASLLSYRGNYSAFERQRSERLTQQQAVYEKQQRRIGEINRFVARFRAQATKARQAQSRLKELERMATVAPAHIDSPFDFEFFPPGRISDPLLSLSKSVVGYPDQPILSEVGLTLHPGSRIALLGANGAGKSTLIKTLAGDLPALGGERVAGEHLSIGYFTQHQLDALDMSASPLLHLQRLTPTATEQSMRNFLGRFDFRGDMALDVIEHFSGGEKARLALAIIVWLKPNLLLLDEPTNHLDLEMRHALTMALQDFAGAVVLISHDRHLIRNTVDELLLVNDGRVAPFEGDLNSYTHWLLSRLRDKGGETSPGPGPAIQRKQQRREGAEIRQQLRPLKKALSEAEVRMNKLDETVGDIENRLADPAIYQPEHKEALQSLLLEQNQFKQQREAVEIQWLELAEQLEALEAALTL
ncbi:ATP-binding cassette domain-containing protein [uncultured Porticoccus sp.]|uniref:ATP-binding cassette domain-containing protein n=1 Tax=uncultured Porticoccus sp. TaxID=1256050 RepID=UPI00341FF2D8